MKELWAISSWVWFSLVNLPVFSIAHLLGAHRSWHCDFCRSSPVMSLSSYHTNTMNNSLHAQKPVHHRQVYSQTLQSLPDVRKLSKSSRSACHNPQQQPFLLPIKKCTFFPWQQLLSCIHTDVLVLDQLLESLKGSPDAVRHTLRMGWYQRMQ